MLSVTAFISCCSKVYPPHHLSASFTRLKMWQIFLLAIILIAPSTPWPTDPTEAPTEDPTTPWPTEDNSTSWPKGGPTTEDPTTPWPEEDCPIGWIDNGALGCFLFSADRVGLSWIEALEYCEEQVGNHRNVFPIKSLAFKRMASLLNPRLRSNLSLSQAWPTWRSP